MPGGTEHGVASPTGVDSDTLITASTVAKIAREGLRSGPGSPPVATFGAFATHNSGTQGWSSQVGLEQHDPVICMPISGQAETMLAPARAISKQIVMSDFIHLIGRAELLSGAAILRMWIIKVRPCMPTVAIPIPIGLRKLMGANIRAVLRDRKQSPKAVPSNRN